MSGVETKRFDYPLPESFSDFDPNDFKEKCCDWLANEAGNRRVAISASGGVDSTAATFLLKESLGPEMVYPFFLEDGARRIIRGRHEHQIAREMFSEFSGMHVIFAQDRFMPKMEGVSDGEAKRKIFINEYREISNAYLKSLDDIGLGDVLIADGTIRPDIVETEGNVKSQHNVGWSYSHGKLEPLASLYKPHVRQVAIALGLSPDFSHRIPCPGPAQWLRTTGAPNQEKMELAQVCTEYVEEAIEEWCLRNWGGRYRYNEETGVREPFEYFAVVLDPGMKENAEMNMATGQICYVMDSRTTHMPEGGKRPDKPLYAPVVWVAGRAKDFDDMLKPGRILWDEFKMPRAVHSIDTIPEDEKGYPVCIRAVMSTDVKECQPMEIDMDYLHFIAEGLRARGASAVGYDASFKPPATVEFE